MGALHAIFFASGALALVYEVLWMRRFTVLFGASAPATAATLSAVFLGLGVGSALLGPRSARWSRPILAFGLLEIGIGLGALLSHPILGAYGSVARSLQPVVSAHPAAAVVLKLLLASLAVFVPTVLMGASLPVLGQALVAGRDQLGVRAGGLYALNTAGAAVGALLVPLVLLPKLGAAAALLAAVSASVALGCAAIAIDVTSRAVAPRGAERPSARKTVAIAAAPRWLAAVALLSGALTLGLEGLWTRMLAQVHESSLYSFAVVLAVFLVGLAAGAGAARILLRRGIGPRRVIAGALLLAAPFVMASPHFFIQLTNGMSYLARGGSLLQHELRVAGVALVVMLPATLLAGAVLPALMELAGGAGERAPAAALGRLLGWNMAGCILGPAVSTFLLVPTVGLWWSLTIVGVLMGVAGVAVFGGPLAPRATAGAVLAVVALLLQPGALARVRLEPGESLVSLREGAMATVAVVDADGGRRMKLDNHYTIGGTLATGDERLQGHLPLLLHPRPRRVAFLGLGTGITASAALFHPVEGVVAVELIPEVVAAAREDFAPGNLDLARDPRVVIVADDARTWLAATRGEHDVIVGDLFVPWRRGEAALYSLEQFEAAREALAPGGLFCQWVPLYQLSEQDFRIVLRTFLAVFPNATAWRGDFHAGEPALALIGLRDAALEPAAIDANGERLARRPDPTNPYLADPAGTWLHLLGPLDAADPWLESAPVHRDDQPWLEILSPSTRVASTDPASGVFVGGRITPFLERLRERPLTGTTLERLDPGHVRWRDAGADLWRASLLAADGNLDAADALGFRTLATLPDAIQLAATGQVLVPSPAEAGP